MGTRSSIRVASAAAALLVGGVVLAPATSSGAPETTGRARQAAPLVPRVLASTRIGAPSGVAVQPDGRVYATEAATGRVFVQHPDGTSEVLISGLDGPQGIAVTDDGTVFVGDGARVVRLAPDGTQTDLDVDGVEEASTLALGPDGTLYLTDERTAKVLAIAPDGTVEPVGFTGIAHPKGVSVDADGTVFVIDADAKDVIGRNPTGTQTAVGFTGLEFPEELSVQGDRIAVADRGRVVVREGDGTQGSPTALTARFPRGIVLDGTGAIYLAYEPDPDSCRCPVGPGSVLVLPDGGSATSIGFGDTSALGSVAAAEADTVLYTSWTGPQGYSDPNPLRRIVGDGAPTDVDTGAETRALMVDAASDGTRYQAADHDVIRTAPDGATSRIAVPTKPGLDAVIDLSVDETGRLFVAVGSGYGPGGFTIVEPLADGGPKTWYEDLDNSAKLDAMAAGGGVIVLSAWADEATRHDLLQVDATGTVSTRSELSDDPVDNLEVDAEGTAYLIRAHDSGASIEVVAADGSTGELVYEGLAFPRDLSMAVDGTLYVTDEGIGVLALDGVGPVVEEPPSTPPPAVPVSGNASFTG